MNAALTGNTFEGRCCVVTGAGAGIGEAVSRALAAQGARVALLDLDMARASAVASELPGARAFACNVADSAAVRRAIEAAASELGPIDVLVNNAGIIGGAEYGRNLERRAVQLEELQQTGAIHTPTDATASMTDGQWRAMLSTHLDGTFYCTRAVLPAMQSRRTGAIVNMGSIIGVAGGNGVPHYAAAKAGIIAFTRAVAQEVAPFGIRVNAVAPGFIDTGMRSQLPPAIAAGHVRATPMGRLGTAQEISDAVLYLCGAGASFVTGQVLGVNGGYL